MESIHHALDIRGIMENMASLRGIVMLSTPCPLSKMPKLGLRQMSRLSMFTFSLISSLKCERLTEPYRRKNPKTRPNSSSQVRLPYIGHAHARAHLEYNHIADTVVLSYAPVGLESQSQFAEEIGGPAPQDILEKPLDKEDNMRMLLDLNGGRCEVVTGVTVGASLSLARVRCSVFGVRRTDEGPA